MNHRKSNIELFEKYYYQKVNHFTEEKRPGKKERRASVLGKALQFENDSRNIIASHRIGLHQIIPIDRICKYL